jgi:hypothetical protein
MWLPFREQSVPPHLAYGYSINQATGDRFPADGSYGQDTFDGYQSLFEALDGQSSLSPEDTPATFDFLSNSHSSVKKGGSSWNSFNFVQHYKRTVDLVDAPADFYSRESGVKWRNYGTPILRFWNDGVPFNLNIVPYSAFGPADIPILGLPPLWEGPDRGVFKSDNGLWTQACIKMLPGIRPASSLINSIYELKDVKTIPHTLSAIHSALDHLNSLLKGNPKVLFNSAVARGGRTLKSILNAGADVYLQGNFNVAPLLQDISNVILTVDRVKNKLNKLVAQSGRPQTTHWGCNLGGFSNSDQQIHIHGRPSDEDADVSIRRVVSYQAARFQATIEYSYEMPDQSYKDLLVHGILDYNGLTVSPQVIWNGIKWSFIIDWLVGVGPWLSQFTGRQLEIVTHVVRSGWSVKVIRNVDISSQPFGRVGACREESYFRTPAKPPLIGSLGVSGLNPKEFSLGAALGITSKKAPH